jgi:5-methyltetrahydropteroyltriglutamate--homocysteine methyltransferase
MRVAQGLPPSALFLPGDGLMQQLPHGDVVGSLLRPIELIAARHDLSTGALSQIAFTEIEDRAVEQSIALQHDAGLELITDGEMRRLSFQSQVPEAIEGFGDYDINAFLWGDWYGDQQIGDLSVHRPHEIGVIGKLRRKRYMSTAEFIYLRDRTNCVPKVTLPSPSLFANFWTKSKSSNAYPTIEEFLSEVTSLLHEEVAMLARLGATYIQLDAPHYPLVLDPKWADFYNSLGWSAESWLTHSVELDNAVIDGFPDVTFALHL